MFGSAGVRASEMASQKVHEDEPVVKSNFSAEPTAHSFMYLSADRNENVVGSSTETRITDFLRIAVAKGTPTGVGGAGRENYSVQCAGFWYDAGALQPNTAARRHDNISDYQHSRY